MTIKEMHIEISQATQNIAANTRRKLLAPEIDWLLNKSEGRFIQGKLTPKPDGSGAYQVDQMDIDSIRTLIKRKEVEVACTEANRYSAFLPADYRFLLADESHVTQLCGTDEADTTAVTEEVLALQFPPTVKPESPYFVTVALSIDDEAVTITGINTIYQGSYAGLTSKAEVFVVQDVLLSYMRNYLGMDVYWERYKDIYRPKHFLFPGKAAGTISVDGGAAVAGGIVEVDYDFYNLTGTSWAPNRLVPSAKRSAMLSTPFYKPTYQSPISELYDQSLLVYGDDRFIVSKVGLQYVKKARRMDLILGQDSELPEDYHQAVCDLATEYFKAMTADPNWEVKLKDNMLRSVPNR